MSKKRIRWTSNADITAEEAEKLFIRHCKVKNLSNQTIKTYENVIKVFFQFLNPETKVNEIMKEDIEEFIFWLKENREIKETTINTYLRHIRSFLYWCMECDYLKRFKIQLIKADKEIKETYTTEELQRLLKKPNVKECTFTEYKTWVFENYLLGTGNRISTALNIKIRDVHFSDGVIILRKTKNRKQQIIPMSKTLEGVLMEYLLYRDGSEEDYLFCNEYGEQGDRRSYQQAVYRYNIKRNVNKTSCHLFRHTFAKNWILNGGDIFRLQKLLGHSSMDIVKNYVNMFSDDLQIGFDEFNPLDNLCSSGTKIRMEKR